MESFGIYHLVEIRNHHGEVEAIEKLTKFFQISILTAVVLSCSSAGKRPSAHFSDAGLLMDEKVAIFDRLVLEINRLDGDGRIFRKNRGESWEQTVNVLRSELRKADDLPAVGRVFKKLDATYANIGSQVYLNSDLEPLQGQGKVLLGVKIVPTLETVNQHDFRFHVSEVPKNLWPAAPQVKVGDELVAINGLEIDRWVNQNFTYCKFPLEVQCALEFEENFRNEILDWDHSKALEMEFIRGDKRITQQIPFRFATPQDNDTDERAIDFRNDSYPCGIDLKRRYQDFGFVYKGRNACVLESHSHPGIAILRISSFSYPDSAEPIRTVKQEVDLLIKSYWKERGPHLKNLVIDVMDNDSSDSPTLYESLLFDKPFQNQYIRYRKVSELSDPDFQENAFFHDIDGGKVIWLKAIKEDGSLDAIPYGQFLDPVPRYCVSTKLDCRTGRFEPFEKTFHGHVSVMINEWCRGGCVDFVYNLSRHFEDGVRFYGIPDSGETSYAHLNVKITLDPGSKAGFIVKTVPNGHSAAEGTMDFVLSQSVSVTQSTNESGKVLSGIPQQVRMIAPVSYKNYPEGYIRDTLKQILADVKK